MFRPAGLVHAVALDGLDEEHRGLPRGVHGPVEGGVHLVRVVAAALEPPDLLVGHIGDQRFRLGIAAEEVLAGGRRLST